MLARLHFVVYTEPRRDPRVDVAEIEARLAAATRAWTDDLRDALVEQLGEERAGAAVRALRRRVPRRLSRGLHRARRRSPDIERLERLDPAGDLGMSLYRAARVHARPPRLQAAPLGGSRSCSRTCCRCSRTWASASATSGRTRSSRATAPPVWIYDFGLRHDAGAEFQADDVREMFEDAFARVWRGEAENDGFNRLVLAARLTAARDHDPAGLREVPAPGRQHVQPDVHGGRARRASRDRARARRALPGCGFDPARLEDTTRRRGRVERELEATIDAVESLDEDRILRSFLRVVRATLRTNYFQTDADGQASRTSRSSSTRRCVPDLPEPRPMFEIFVYSPRVEGVHLRGGQGRARRHPLVRPARGLPHRGARADEGADGEERRHRPGRRQGRLRRQAAAAGGDRDALLEEVVECYRTFMRGLLDVTDNLVGGKVVPPPDVVRHDDDDPYLVVAADKGTATFSDIANAIALEYGFWLGDAFASGGSAGYDHKEMGITARGAWESVKRHFRELGIDIETTDFTVVGIGDMSGDVFGNGMLLSRHIRLVAAFDHRHVFLDPDSGPGGELRRARAAVRAAALVLGRLRPRR